MASIASVWRAASCRMSRRTNVSPKAATRRRTSVSRPSAMTSLPVSRRERSHSRSVPVNSSSVRGGEAGASSCPGVPARWRSTARRASSMRPCKSLMIARYGSWAPPARPCSSLVASVIDSSNRSASISRAYSESARQRAIRQVRRVTSAVTEGFPSRSPPIQDPKRIGASSSGNPRPVTCSRVRSSVRLNCGTASHSVSSNTASPDRTSSSGEGRSRRTSSVCHAPAISRRTHSSSASRSARVRSPRSSSPSAAAIPLYLCCRVRRMISVGCAVITSSIRSRHTASCSASGDRPPATSRGSTSSTEACWGRPFGSRWSARRRRIRWCCSAMLARFRKCAKLRATGSAASTGIARSSPASVSKSSPAAASRAGSNLVRRRLASARTRSTRS